jgi:archaellum component FlaC
VIVILVFDVCFFAQVLALSKSMVAKRASEASQQNRVAELEQANAELRAELGQSRIKIAEMEERQNSLHSSYDQ